MEGAKVITSAYDLIKWAIPHIVKFPRNQRYTLGERGENKLFSLLELLVEVQHSKPLSFSKESIFKAKIVN